MYIICIYQSIVDGLKYHIILHKTQFFVHLYQGFRKKNSANSFLTFEGKKITDEF